jgi:RNA polymerase sigma-70 factor (ECF subfamily)
MSDDDQLDDAQLARLAATGSVDAFARLAARYQVGVVHYLRHLAGRGGHHDADDVAQDAFVRAWRAIDRYDSRWAFSTWLFTIARRTWLNHARSERRRRVREAAAAPTAFTAADPCQAALAIERATRLWQQAAVELSERQFTALWLRYVEDQSVAEIAAVLEEPTATVKVILFRGRRRLEPLGREWME